MLSLVGGIRRIKSIMNKFDSHIKLLPGTIIVHKIKRNKKKKITSGPFYNEKNDVIEYFAHDGKFDKLTNMDNYEVYEESLSESYDKVRGVDIFLKK